MLGGAMEISNKTKRPLKVNLPGGKRLHLAPRGTGQITAKAAEHPPVLKMIEEGLLAIQSTGKSTSGGAGSSPASGNTGSPNAGFGGGLRHTGDR